jgi:hypothetical protein
MPDELHELSDKELREKLASGELSDKKAQIARVTLRGAGRSALKHGSSVMLGLELSSWRLD